MTLGPVTPSWMDKINFIKYYMGNPCNVPFMAYIETALPVVGDIAVTMLTIDPWGFTKNVLRPRNLRTNRHGRRGNRGNRRPGGIPDPADLLADVLDPDKTLNPRRRGNKVEMLLTLDDLAENASNLAFVIDSGIDIPYRSILGVLELNRQHCPGNGSYLREGGQDSIHALVGPNQSFAIHSIVYNVGINQGTQFSIPTNQGIWGVTVTGKVKRNSGGNATLSMRLRDTNHNETIGGTGDMTINTGSDIGFSMSGQTRPGSAIQWQATISSSGADIYDTAVFANRVG